MKHVCRICIKEISDSNLVTLTTEEPSQVKMQLSFCVPEMVVDLVKDPVFCKFCVSVLDSAYNFKNLCLRTEEHIKNLKILPNESIDIKDVLYHLQQHTNGVCEDNGEGDNERDGFVITPNTNFLLFEEDVANGQNLNTESKPNQQSAALPVDAFNKIINASNVTTNGINTADEFSSLLDDAVCNTFVQPLPYKQEVKNEYKDITIEEDILVPKVEPLWSYDGYENNSFEDVKSEYGTTDIKNNKASFQTNIVIQNCFVKLTRLPDNIACNNVNKSYYICDRCAYTAKSASQLARHSVVHRTKNKYVLVKQEIIDNPKRPFSCSHCSFKTHIKYRLKTHIRLCHMEKLFTCKVCKFATRYKSNLKKHERTHDETRRFSCTSCKFYCLSKQKLIKHVRVHTGEKLFACNVCTFRSAHKISLQLHLRLHSGEKPFACNECNYQSAQRSHLIEHLRIHTGEKPFACNVCKFRSAQKSYLKQHLQLHTGEKPFACNECKYRSAHKSHLKRHLRIHTGAKPYSCFVCTFCFAHKSSLQRHLRNHTGEKPFVCNVCHFRCTRPTDLQNHLRIHSGAKPYSCDVCTFRSAQKSSLRRHLLTHTGEEA